MSKLLYQLTGIRGRSMAIYDRKVVFFAKSTPTAGNASDAEKTIFFRDVVGIQYKNSGSTIGYLQFETAAQVNSQSSTYTENTFVFEANKNGITDEQMEAIYHQVCDILEEIKYGDVTKDDQPEVAEVPEIPVVAKVPVFEAPVAPVVPEAPVFEAPVAPVIPEPPAASPVIPFTPVAAEAAPATLDCSMPTSDTIFCPMCGGSVPSFATFCTNCGRRLR